jgi:predicted dehydrogenase
MKSDQPNRPLRLAAIGCGGRTRTYFELAAKMPQFYQVVAAADPLPERLKLARELSGNPDFLAFASDAELLARPKLADIMIIGTQDQYHVEPCLAAMEMGYDILLEKPVAPNLRDVLAIEKRASELGRRVLVCHVLRYTPFYSKVHEIIASGVLGEIITLNASEGVDPWHQAHSFVRGHWAVVEKSTPMILAKSCHDLDIISWLMDRPCAKISSHGNLSHFTAAHAPEGAPPRCTDGCPVSGTCPYDAHHYLGRHRQWVQYVHENPLAGDAEILGWLRRSPWGRCVYRCDNTAVDHQVVAMEFDDGATATFTMTAFDSGRNIEIMGAKGVLRGGDGLRRQSGSDIALTDHATGSETRYRVAVEDGGYGGHGGGDGGIVRALHGEMTCGEAAAMRSSIQRSVQSHLMAFAAETARLEGSTIRLDDFEKAHCEPVTGV